MDARCVFVCAVRLVCDKCVFLNAATLFVMNSWKWTFATEDSGLNIVVRAYFVRVRGWLGLLCRLACKHTRLTLIFVCTGLLNLARLM